jgi:hypothetical protein
MTDQCRLTRRLEQRCRLYECGFIIPWRERPTKYCAILNRRRIQIPRADFKVSQEILYCRFPNHSEYTQYAESFAVFVDV